MWFCVCTKVCECECVRWMIVNECVVLLANWQKFLQLHSVRCLIIIAVHVSPSNKFFPMLSGNVIHLAFVLLEMWSLYWSYWSIYQKLEFVTENRNVHGRISIFFVNKSRGFQFKNEKNEVSVEKTHKK